MIESPRAPWLLVLVLLAALVAALWIAAPPRESGIAVSMTERGPVITSAPPAPAIEREMERRIKAASDTVRDFVRRYPSTGHGPDPAQRQH
jgi:hypothetical protein